MYTNKMTSTEVILMNSTELFVKSSFNNIYN